MRAVRPMCVPPPAHHDRDGPSTCGAAARRDPPSQPALAEGARRAARCVPPAARRDRGGTSTRCAARDAAAPLSLRWRRAPRLRAAAGASRSRWDEHALCRPHEATGCAPCGLCVHCRRRVAIAAGRARAVPPARRDRPPYRQFLFACCIHSVCLSTGIPRRRKRLRLATPCCIAPGRVSTPQCMLCPPTPQGSSSRACAFAHAPVACAMQPDSC
jgi:hypothetical protein